MSPEQLLLAAISSVTAALIWVSGKLWARSEKCEQDRAELRKTLERVLLEVGEARGELQAYRRCGEELCPFKSSPLTTSD